MSKLAGNPDTLAQAADVRARELEAREQSVEQDLAYVPHLLDRARREVSEHDDDDDSDNVDDEQPRKRRRVACGQVVDVSKLKEVIVEHCKPKVQADLATIDGAFNVDHGTSFDTRFPGGYRAVKDAVDFDVLMAHAGEVFPMLPSKSTGRGCLTQREAMSHALQPCKYFVEALPDASKFPVRQPRFWTRPDRQGHHAADARRAVSTMVRDLKVELMQFVVNCSHDGRLKGLEAGIAERKVAETGLVDFQVTAIAVMEDMLSLFTPEMRSAFDQLQAQRHGRVAAPNPQD